MRFQAAGLKGIKLTVQEFSGGLGDMGTFLPLAASLCVVVGFNPGAVLFWAGVLNIATGLLFRLPFPVQPMKALAAVAIAGELTHLQVSAAGLEMAVLLILFSALGLVRRLYKYIPAALVRGIQAGIGIKLAMKGITFCAQIPSGDSLLMATAALSIAVILLSGRFHRIPAALIVFLGGAAFCVYQKGLPWSPGFDLSFADPTVPGTGDWFAAMVHGVSVQLPLTLLNSVVAVCALSKALFPEREVSETRIAASVGIMNAVSCLFGGMPVCHGAGGLAAQYRFGARTGGSVILLGACFILTGLFLNTTALALIKAYPKGILGVMLLAAGWELVKQVSRNRTAHEYIICGITALTMIFFEAMAGFCAGAGAAVLLSLIGKKKGGNNGVH